MIAPPPGGIPSDSLIFTVEDNGVGIPDEARGRVFQIFARLDTGSGTEHGHGMGLAITQRTLERLRGTIWFEARLERGTRFFVMLPQGRKGLS